MLPPHWTLLLATAALASAVDVQHSRIHTFNAGGESTLLPQPLDGILPTWSSQDVHHTVDASVGRRAIARWHAKGYHSPWGNGPLDPDDFAEDEAEKAAFHLMMHPPMPGPGSFAPKQLASGKEYDMAELSGAERMQMSSFANRSRARASPELWTDPLKLYSGTLSTF